MNMAPLKNQLLIWATLITCHRVTVGLINFEIPKNDIVHTKSGLILHYLSEYRPANRIITFTVTIAMVPDMCYLIPKGAMKKIPMCNPNSPSILKYAEEEETMPSMTPLTPSKSRIASIKSQKPLSSSTSTLAATPAARSGSMKAIPSSQPARVRSKRWLPAIISIGAGLASTVLSATNMVQTANLKSEMNNMKQSLQILQSTSYNFEAKMIRLTDGQLKLAHELNFTQMALNKTIIMVNEHAGIVKDHAQALRTILSQTVFLSTRLASLVHAVETHFIHTSIEQILSNRLNLLFIHQHDLPKVVNSVYQAMNISFDEAENSIPLVELITKLLVRQQIDFIPAKKLGKSSLGVILGNLVITSFFATPTANQRPFSIYELIPIPFNDENKRVRLAQMPAYIGIETQSKQVLRWSKEEAESCDFVLMPSCRETPPRRSEAPDDCLFQILTDSKLVDCRIEPYADKVFVRRVGKHWVVSTTNTTKCHSITTTEMDQHSVHDNDEITLPPVAMITTMDMNSLVCDRFFLPGLPSYDNDSLHLIYNKTINPFKKDFLDLDAHLANETHWAKLPYIASDIQAIIEFMTNTTQTTPVSTSNEWKGYVTHLQTIALAIMCLTVGSVLVYLQRKKAQITNIAVTIPSMKTLQTLHE